MAEDTGGNRKRKPDQSEIESNALFREIDEELRQEQFQTLWQKYGWLAVGGALLIVAVVAGTQGWKAWTHRQNMAAAEQYFQAMEQVQAEEPAAAAETLGTLADENSGGYARLAGLQAAGLWRAATPPALNEARANLERVQALAGDDTAFAGLTTLLEAQVSLAEGEPDTARATLQAVTGDTSAWAPLARELEAVALLEKGDTAAARTAFAALSKETNLTPGVRQRAQEMLLALGDPAATAALEDATRDDETTDTASPSEGTDAE